MAVFSTECIRPVLPTEPLLFFSSGWRATDALEESKPEPQNPGSSLIALCKIVYPFNQEKFSREISLLTHIYN